MLDNFPLVINTAIFLATALVYRRKAGVFFAIFAVLALGLSAWFDSVCVYEYPVHTTGAVLITGASTGIGRSAAVKLAKDSKYTVYAGVRKEKDAVSINNEKLPNLKPLLLDVVKSEEIEYAVQNISAAGEPLVALVNNAGILDNYPVELVSKKTWQSIFDVNVFSLAECTSQFLPLLRKVKGSRIVNIGSVAGDISPPGWSPYSASKHAVEAISDGLRKEVMDFGISVSLVKPGAIKTEIWRQGRQDGSNPVEEAKKTAAKVREEKARGSNEVKELYRQIHETNAIQAATIADAPDVPTTEITDAAIIHAITSAHPKTRYLVGGDCWVFYYLDNYLTTDRLWDSFYYWLYQNEGWKSVFALPEGVSHW